MCLVAVIVAAVSGQDPMIPDGRDQFLDIFGCDLAPAFYECIGFAGISQVHGTARGNSQFDSAVFPRGSSQRDDLPREVFVKENIATVFPELRDDFLVQYRCQ